MKTLITHLWEKLRASFWFVPGLTVLFFGACGIGGVEFDRRWGEDLAANTGILGNVSPAGARAFLSTAATSVLALAGVTFSATLVALTLASGQFGSRLLRNFIRALPNQLTLGILLGTFVLCLIVLRNVRELGDGIFVPHAASMVAFVATIASLFMFIYFIHHIAKSLQSERIIAVVYQELDTAIEEFFPVESADQDPVGDEEKAGKARKRWENSDDEEIIQATTTGYVQAINTDGLVELTTSLGKNCRARVLTHPGQFVVPGEPIVAASGGSTGNCDRWRDYFLVGSERTPEQDFEHCFRQLVETGLRALSPGINDSFTAMHCIDYIGAAVAKIAGRRLPRWEFHDDEGIPRVQIRPVTFESVMATAFHQLRQAAEGKPDVGMRMLEAFAIIARNCNSKEANDEVHRHADLVSRDLEAASLPDVDIECIRQRIERIQHVANK